MLSVYGAFRGVRAVYPFAVLTLISWHGFARQGRVLELRHGHVWRSTHPTGPCRTRFPAPRPRPQHLGIQFASCRIRDLRGGHETSCNARNRTRAACQHRRSARRRMRTKTLSTTTPKFTIELTASSIPSPWRGRRNPDGRRV
eukprot:scaffold840_cov344-Pavlova_lutheri.AAC.36